MEYRLIRSRRSTLSVSIDKNGHLTVRAPLELPVQKIEEFIQSKKEWIEKYSSDAAKRREQLMERLALPPEKLPFLGEMCPVAHTQPYGYTDGCFHLPEGFSLEALLPYLRRLYCSLAKDALISRTKLIADRMGIKISGVKINSAKTRWGSCSSEKTINLSWKLIAADTKLIDYVIIHELCHTLYMNHSPEFWDTVRAVVPDYTERREALKDVQRILSEYGFE